MQFLDGAPPSIDLETIADAIASTLAGADAAISPVHVVFPARR
jgi:hypothetical protein